MKKEKDIYKYKNKTATVILALISLFTHTFYAFKNSQGMLRYIFGSFSAQTGGVIKDHPIINYVVLAQGILLSLACILWILYAVRLHKKENSNVTAAVIFSMLSLAGIANVTVNAYSFFAWVLHGEMSYAKLGYIVNAVAYGDTLSSTAEVVGKILIYCSEVFIIALIIGCVKAAVCAIRKEPMAEASVLFKLSFVYIIYLAITFIFSSCVPYINGYAPCGADIFWDFVAILFSILGSSLQLVAIALSVKLFYISNSRDA